MFTKKWFLYTVITSDFMVDTTVSFCSIGFWMTAQFSNFIWMMDAAPSFIYFSAQAGQV